MLVPILLNINCLSRRVTSRHLRCRLKCSDAAEEVVGMEDERSMSGESQSVTALRLQLQLAQTQWRRARLNWKESE